MSRVHTVRKLDRPDGWATHKTGCGIPLTSNGGKSFERAPISSGEMILTTALGREANCLRCVRSERSGKTPD